MKKTTTRITLSSLVAFIFGITTVLAQSGMIRDKDSSGADRPFSPKAQIGTSGSSVQPDSEADCWIDVSHSQGIPLGGLGTGYSVFGQYGFIRSNFDGRPDNYSYGYETPETVWGYTIQPVSSLKALYGFVLSENGKSYVLQAEKASWKSDAEPFDSVKAFAYLPMAQFNYLKAGLGLRVSMKAFTPLIPGDIATSATPVQIFEINIENTGTNKRDINLSLLNSAAGVANVNKTIFSSSTGEIGFGAINGKAKSYGVDVNMSIEAGESKTAMFYIAWYFPAVKHIEDDNRYYASLYKNASEVVDQSMASSGLWKSKVEQWHRSLGVPTFLKRLWFSSLSSVMTSTMLGSGPSFYEIETPHPCLNTMDVNCYSSWMYLINWPEIEKLDMDQSMTKIPTSGDRAGFVWHSMIDEADYVEEPCFLTRTYRDYLWFNDTLWLKKAYPYNSLAANRVYRTDGFAFLINSDHGNQSYDAWKMPGISAFINTTWIYGLHSLGQMSEIMHQPAKVSNMPVARFCNKAIQSHDSLLWNPNPGYYNCFFRTPTASKAGFANTIFSDQLFGKWMLGIARDADNVLDSAKVRQSLLTIYGHNLIENKQHNFRGWANGLRPGRKPDYTGYHANMCWFGAQFNLASLLGLMGEEAASLDVIQSVESSLHNNHLAAGEWNQTFGEELIPITSSIEPAKDSPRFPAYPRYKSAWEYLVRMIGLQMDETAFYLKPFKTINFSIKDYVLAGTRFSIKVEKDWDMVLVDGKVFDGELMLDRNNKNYTLEFVKKISLPGKVEKMPVK